MDFRWPIVSAIALLPLCHPGASLDALTLDQFVFPVSAPPDAIASDDLDGDGDIDLALVARSSDSVRVRLNSAGPGFPVEEQYILPPSASPRLIVTLDVDLDGDPDLVVGGMMIGRFFTLLNQGHDPQGGWLGFDLLEHDTNGKPVVLARGDLDGDGLEDLIVASHIWHEIMIHRNLGAGPTGEWLGFGAPIHVGQMFFGKDVVTGDFDSDGKIDIVALGSGIMSGIWIMWNDSSVDPATQEFIWSVEPPPLIGQRIITGSPGTPLAIVTGDFNGDHFPDLAHTSDAAGMTTLAGRGIRNESNPAGSFIIQAHPFWGGGSNISAADFDGDGRTDLVATLPGPGAGLSGNVSVALNDSPQASHQPLSWQPAEYYPLHPGTTKLPVTPVAVGVGDFDSDSVSDFVTGNDLAQISASVSVFVGQGSAPPGAVFIRGDVTGDGRVEIGDAVVILGFVDGGIAPLVTEAADVDDNEAVELADALYLLEHAFLGGPPPPAPYPLPGLDPTV